MYVPEQFQAGFSDMIDEYVHFNDSARNSIMERMTPDYMVVGIGSKTESYKYKSEIISDETAFYACGGKIVILHQPKRPKKQK